MILTDLTNFYITFGTIGSLLLLIGLFYAIFHKKIAKIYNTKSNKTFYKSYIHVYDLEKQEVKSINTKELDNIEIDSFVEFLNRFSEQAQFEVKNWFNLLFSKTNLDLESSESVLLVTLKKNKKFRKNYRILFTCNSVDIKNKRLCLDSEVLYDLPCELEKNKKKFKKIINDISEIKKSYEDGYFQRGINVVIRLFKKVNSTSAFNETVLRYIVLDSFSRLFSNSNSFYYFKDDDELEIAILDSRFFTMYQFNNLLKSVKDEISKILEVSGYKNSYDFTVAGALVGDLNHDFNKMHLSMQKLIEANKELNKKISIYKREEGSLKTSEQIYKPEIAKILKEQGVHISYQGVFKIGEKITSFGHIADFSVTSPSFGDYNEFLKYVSLYEYDRELISLILKKAVTKYVNEKYSFFSKLIIPIAFKDITQIIKVLGEINGISEANIIFLINNNQFIDIEDEEYVGRLITSLKAKDVSLGVYIEADNYHNLKSSTYDCFEAFFVDPRLGSDAKQNKAYLRAHAIFDKLVKYNKPIITVGIKTWPQLELLNKIGLQYFASDILQANTKMIVPLDNKLIKKLTSLKK